MSGLRGELVVGRWRGTWQFRSGTDPVLAAGHRRDLLDRGRAGRTIIAGGHFVGHVFGSLDADGSWTAEH